MSTLCLILASGFWLLTGATIATTVADVELTQHCIRAGTCHEGNPLLSADRKRAYAVQIPLAIGASYLGHRWRKDGFKYWWVPQTAIVAGHGVGIGFGLRFVW
jgi:hypothetical protein